MHYIFDHYLWKWVTSITIFKDTLNVRMRRELQTVKHLLIYVQALKSNLQLEEPKGDYAEVYLVCLGRKKEIMLFWSITQCTFNHLKLT